MKHPTWVLVVLALITSFLFLVFLATAYPRVLDQFADVTGVVLRWIWRSPIALATCIAVVVAIAWRELTKKRFPKRT